MNLSIVILTLWFLESSCGRNLIHADGRSLGHLGQTKEFVDEVNRIIGVARYSYEDRMDRDKSFAMARTWFRYQMKDKEDYEMEHLFLSFRCGVTGSRYATNKQKKYVEHAFSVYNQIIKGTELCKLK